jgi:hypothetical protein
VTEQIIPAGAMPAEAGATPAQSAPAQPGAPSTTIPATTPATGAADQEGAELGDAGKRAIDAERAKATAADKRAKAAEAELEKLRTATLSDTEKAIDQAKKDGAAEVLTRIHGQVRRSEVRTALISAGLTPSLLSLAAKSDEFEALKVSDDGEVEGLDDAVAGFKKAHADLFGKPGIPGSFDTGTGAGGRPAGKPTYTREQLRDTAFYAANKADILLAQREGRITQ